MLLIKVAWGGRSIHKPFRPPGALPTDEELKQMVADAQAKFQEQTKSYEAKKAAGKKARKPKPAPPFAEHKVQFGDSYRKLIAHTK